MLKKTQRLTTPLFTEVMTKGKVIHSPLFILRIMKYGQISRISVTVSKKVAKTAVERNKIRRRTYSVVHKLHPTLLPGFATVLIAKQPVSSVGMPTLEKDIKEIFVKSGLLK